MKINLVIPSSYLVIIYGRTILQTLNMSEYKKILLLKIITIIQNLKNITLKDYIYIVRGILISTKILVSNIFIEEKIINYISKVTIDKYYIVSAYLNITKNMILSIITTKIIRNLDEK